MEMTGEKCYRTEFTLLNASLAPLPFSVSSSEPFCLHDMARRELANCSLKPKTKLRVPVLFRLNQELIDSLPALANDSNDDDSQNSNSSGSAGRSSWLISESIAIAYMNGSSQHIGVTMRICAPTLRATKSKLDFDTCLVGQERCQQFVIRNPSDSSLIWRSSIREFPIRPRIISISLCVTCFGQLYSK